MAFTRYNSVQEKALFHVKMMVIDIKQVYPKQFIGMAVTLFLLNKIENFRRVYPKGKSEKKSITYEEVMSFSVGDFT